MGDVGMSAFKWGIKIAYALGITSALIAFLLLGVSSVGVLLNESVVLDLLYLIQMWLPFNLTPLFSWLFVTVSSYFMFRLYLMGYNLLHQALD